MENDHVQYPENKALELEEFKAMDYFTVSNYHLPIELMMENAGLQLAKLIARFTKKNQTIRIGIGNGNNGGGGLVAARRLLAWGYVVYLDLPFDITKELVLKQLKRAVAFGALTSNPKQFDVWIDAYLGFSQRLPLPEILLKKCLEFNKSKALKISLDIPTGFTEKDIQNYFRCDKILTLAAPKKILYYLPEKTEIYIADLGIPKEVYKKFNVEPLAFNINTILRLVR